jgi:hypothetical protein
MEHPDNAANREYCRHFWDRIEQDMLQAYRSFIAEQVEHPLTLYASDVVEHRMELALRSFIDGSSPGYGCRRQKCILGYVWTDSAVM